MYGLFSTDRLSELELELVDLIFWCSRISADVKSAGFTMFSALRELSHGTELKFFFLSAEFNVVRLVAASSSSLLLVPPHESSFAVELVQFVISSLRSMALINLFKPDVGDDEGSGCEFITASFSS